MDLKDIHLTLSSSSAFDTMKNLVPINVGPDDAKALQSPNRTLTSCSCKQVREKGGRYVDH